MIKIKLALILVLVGLVLLTPSLVSAQEQTGPIFGFHDKSLSPGNMRIYADTNGSMSYVTTINTSGHFVYDPTSDYKIVLEPSIMNTYGSQPTGWFDLIINNPEAAAIIFAIIVVLAIIALFVVIFTFRRTSR